ncbi:putative 2-aminoethylphosphonate ABC transporter ATP-binding protein [uncultured Metabacillus sp.]|uniref:putative 2-aminoethylphosphonate ABC transporter ATP-binding protein n=1 Tax=uncultured Metabacillus sp. TaxID=2860135 RepID=UPI002634BE37|nr:putative 2-aminoethylphosphonate ABC transporter ATP-binding protein [uncultured Metabacillus sp.]
MKHQPFLEISHISKEFGSFKALDDINFTVKKNEFVCLLGPSGCGKTTLLRIIAGLETPSNGGIQLEGKDLTSLPPAKRDFGIVFQSYALFPNLTAYQNVEYGLKNRKIKKKERQERVKEALEMVDLLPIQNKYPAQLSGGQQQRVALARAIALSPKFLLLDEPLSALDAKVRDKLRYEIRSIQEKIGITTIMVTHDQEEALTMADKVVVMKNAKIMQVGSPQEIYNQPRHPFVADFIGSINMFKPEKQGPGINKVIGIRPEHIQLSHTEGVNARIENLEFRGSSYRLQLSVEDCSSSLNKQIIKADVSASMIREYRLKKDVTVFIQFPEPYLLTYEEQVVI